MRKIAPSSLDRAVELLHTAAPKATIVLFGSHARGDAQADSDGDLLVVEPRMRSRRREMVRLTDVLPPLAVAGGCGGGNGVQVGSVNRCGGGDGLRRTFMAGIFGENNSWIFKPYALAIFSMKFRDTFGRRPDSML